MDDALNPLTAKPRKSATSMPPGWAPNEQHETLAAELGLDIDHEVFKFREHANRTNRRIPSWNGAFSRWLTLAVIYERKREVARERSE